VHSHDHWVRLLFRNAAVQRQADLVALERMDAGVHGIEPALPDLLAAVGHDDLCRGIVRLVGR